MPLLSFSLPFTGVSRKRRINFYTQFELMLDAGLPPVRSLRTIAENERSSKLRHILLDMAAHIETGGSLASAFERYPDVFPPLERSMIGSAESGGFSSQAMSSIASHQAGMRHLSTRFWIEMIYPGMLLFTALVVCPLLRALFLGGVENLLISLAWNAAGAFGIILCLIVIYRFLNALYFTRLIFHHIALRLPLFRSVIRGFAKTRFAKTLSSLYIAGLPVREAYTQSAQSCGNEVITRRLLASRHVLDEGGDLSQTITSTGLFDSITLGMISTGEEIGKLDQILNKYAQYEEQETQVHLKVLSNTFPMLIYFLVAAYVIYIVFNAYMSYFSFIQ